jgi:WD40 repeat protein
MSGECLRILEGHTGGVFALAVLSEGTLASGSEDCTVRVWDTESGACLFTLEGHTSYAKCLAVLSDGTLVSGSFDGTLRVWKDGACLRTIVTGSAVASQWIVEGPSSASAVQCLAALPDCKLATATRDYKVRVWDAVSGQCLLTFTGHTALVDALIVLPDGKLASGSFDETVRVWDTGRPHGVCERSSRAAGR